MLHVSAELFFSDTLNIEITCCEIRGVSQERGLLNVPNMYETRGIAKTGSPSGSEAKLTLRNQGAIIDQLLHRHYNLVPSPNNLSFFKKDTHGHAKVP